MRLGQENLLKKHKANDSLDDFLSRYFEGHLSKFSKSDEVVGPATGGWCKSYSDNKLKRFGLFSELERSECSVVYIVGVMDDDAAVFAGANGWQYVEGLETTPEMNRVMNSMRPKLHKIKVDQKDALMVSCFPGYAWTYHVAKMVKTSFPEEYVVNQIFEVDELRNCRVWDDLMNHFGPGGLKGKRVVIGYVEEVAKQFQPNENYTQWRDSPKGFYRSVTVFKESSYHVILLGVRHAFWGDIAGVLACKLYQLGAFEIVHVAKSGTLEHSDFQLQFITPKSFLPHFDDWKQRNVCDFDVKNEAALRLEGLHYLTNRSHVSFLSPLDETEATRKAAVNQATSVDVELSFMVGAIAECNSHGGRKMRFSCIHWISDYLWREKEVELNKFMRGNLDAKFCEKFWEEIVNLNSDKNVELKRRAAEYCAFLAYKYLSHEVLLSKKELLNKEVVCMMAIVEEGWVSGLDHEWTVLCKKDETCFLVSKESLLLLIGCASSVGDRRKFSLSNFRFAPDWVLFLDDVDVDLRNEDKISLKDHNSLTWPDMFQDFIQSKNGESKHAIDLRTKLKIQKFFSFSSTRNMFWKLASELEVESNPRWRNAELFNNPGNVTVVFDLHTSHVQVLRDKSALDQAFEMKGVVLRSSSIYVVTIPKALAWYHLFEGQREKLLQFEINKVDVFPGSLNEQQRQLVEQVQQGELTSIEATLQDTLNYLRDREEEWSLYREPILALLVAVFDVKKLRVRDLTLLNTILESSKESVEGKLNVLGSHMEKLSSEPTIQRLALHARGEGRMKRARDEGTNSDGDQIISLENDIEYAMNNRFSALTMADSDAYVEESLKKTCKDLEELKSWLMDAVRVEVVTAYEVDGGERLPQSESLKKRRPMWARSGKKVSLFVFPGKSMAFHWGLIVRHFLQRLSLRCEFWCGWNKTLAEDYVSRCGLFGLVGRKSLSGHLVVLGYVEEAEKYLRDFELREEKKGGGFAMRRYERRVAAGATVRVATLSSRDTFWGDIAARLGEHLFAVGDAAEILLLGKCGSTNPEALGKTAIPKTSALISDVNTETRKMSPMAQELLFKADFAHERLFFGELVSVDSLLVEHHEMLGTMMSQGNYFVDVESGHFAEAARKCGKRFSCCHLVTDILRKNDVVKKEEHNLVKQKQNPYLAKTRTNHPLEYAIWYIRRWDAHPVPPFQLKEEIPEKLVDELKNDLKNVEWVKDHPFECFEILRRKRSSLLPHFFNFKCNSVAQIAELQDVKAPDIFFWANPKEWRIVEDAKKGDSVFISFKITDESREILSAFEERGVHVVQEENSSSLVGQTNLGRFGEDFVSTAPEDLKGPLEILLEKCRPSDALEKVDVCITKLTVAGFGPFREEFSYSLNGYGMGLVTGQLRELQSNGFGKSTLSITALLWCLCGLVDKNASGLTASSVDLLNPDANGLGWVEVSGTRNGKDWRATRRIFVSPAGAARTQLLFAIGGVEEGSDDALTEATTKEIAKQVFNFEGSSAQFRDFLMTTLFWNRHASCLWLSEGNQVVREYLSMLFDVKRLNEIEKEVKAQKNEADVAKSKAKDERICQEAVLKNLKKQVKVLETKLNSEKELFQRLQDSSDREVQRLKKELEAAEVIANDAEAKLKLLDEKKVDAEQQLAIAEEALGQIAVPNLVAVKAGQQCGLCQQVVSKDHLSAVRKEIAKTKKEQKAAEAKVKKLKKDVDSAEKSQRQSQKDVAKQLEHVNALKAKKVQMEEHVEKSSAEVKASLASQEDTIRQRKSEIEAQESISLQRIQNESDAKNRLLLLKELELFVGPKGRMQEMYARSMLKVFQDDANRWLKRFFQGGKWRCELFIEDGKVERKIYCPNNKGRERSPAIETLSDSEFNRCHIAFFLAYSRMVQRYRNMGTRLVIFDECFSGVDPFNTALVLSALASEAESNQLTILVASITPMHYLRFPWDQTVMLEDRGHASVFGEFKQRAE